MIDLHDIRMTSDDIVMMQLVRCTFCILVGMDWSSCVRERISVVDIFNQGRAICDDEDDAASSVHINIWRSHVRIAGGKDRKDTDVGVM